MIRGLEHFKNHFRDYCDDFTLIGGVASYVLLDEAGAQKVRPTKDLDIVLMIKPSKAFLDAIKEYVKDGEYEIQKGDNDQATFYRFLKPTNEAFPVMLELFATVESDFDLYKEQHIIPISTPNTIKSLSAILLDKEYYALIKNNAVKNNGINLLNPLALIPFKAKAYLEIKERKEDSKNWKKHRSDIINLTVAFLTENTKEKLTGKVRNHFIEFMKQLKIEISSDIIKGACKQKISSEEIISLLERTFL